MIAVTKVGGGRSRQTLARTWDWDCRDDLYSGKHRDTGFNLQIAATLSGRLFAVGTPVPGARRDSHAWTALGSPTASTGCTCSPTSR